MNTGQIRSALVGNRCLGVEFPSADPSQAVIAAVECDEASASQNWTYYPTVGLVGNANWTDTCLEAEGSSVSLRKCDIAKRAQKFGFNSRTKQLVTSSFDCVAAGGNGEAASVQTCLIQGQDSIQGFDAPAVFEKLDGAVDSPYGPVSPMPLQEAGSGTEDCTKGRRTTLILLIVLAVVAAALGVAVAVLAVKLLSRSQRTKRLIY
jgi:hypothetical protein